MKKKLLSFILLILIFSCYNKLFSQTEKFTIRDSINLNPLPYSNIKFTNNPIVGGVYSNELGEFYLDNKISSEDSIVISYVGYYSKKLTLRNLTNVIYLQPKLDELDEIFITKKEIHFLDLGLLDKKSNLTWHIKPKLELTTLIESKKDIRNNFIKEIKIPISKWILKSVDGKLEKTFPKYSSIFKIHLYEAIDGKPDNVDMILPIIVECDQDSPEIISINISTMKVEFPINGLFIGIEMVGTKNSEGEIIDENSLPSFKFTNKKNKKIEAVSYYKNPFLENKWIRIDNQEQFSFLKKDYNLAIGITLVLYEN